MPIRLRPRLRRSPHLVVYWQAGQSVIHNFATGDLVAGHPFTLAVLDFFSGWRHEDEFLDSEPARDRRLLKQLVSQLARRRVLQVEGRETARESAMHAWSDWNPAAGFFHQATRDVAFAPLEEVEARDALPRPAPVKPKRPGRQIVLPRPRTDGEYPSVLLGRRTWRAFDAEPLPLAAVSTLLWFTAGVQRWEEVHGGGKAPLKTSPSGGALHPTEVYVLALAVDALAPGLYHYRQDAHRLQLIRRGAPRADVVRFLPQQPWYMHAGIVVFFTTVFARSLWRYSYARAYRANLVEAGHYCQTFCLTATWLGLAPFCSMALADSAIERAIGIDGLGEAVLYAAGAGRRPDGVSWAPAPLDPRIPWLGATSSARARRARVRKTPGQGVR